VQLPAGASYTARLGAGVCDRAGNCTARDLSWTFQTAADSEKAGGNTAISPGFITREAKGKPKGHPHAKP
jgi:hypothetical protein